MTCLNLGNYRTNTKKDTCHNLYQLSILAFHTQIKIAANFGYILTLKFQKQQINNFLTTKLCDWLKFKHWILNL